MQRIARKNELKTAKIAELPVKGSLEDFSSRLLLSELNRLKFTGVLSLRMKEKTKKLWFSQGEVFRIQSNLRSELFGQMAVDRQWMNQDDLNKCLDEQKKINSESQQAHLRLGELLKVKSILSDDQIQKLRRHQFIGSLVQSLTWSVGVFEVRTTANAPVQATPVAFKDLILSIESLFEQNDQRLGSLFQVFEVWGVSPGLISLAEYPIWSILAGCRQKRASGIITIRKQSKLYELIIKDGVPMILYEGSFQRPRQTVVVRQTSEEHEAYFRDQLFYCFTFVAGNASFRTFDTPPSQSVVLEPIESTQVVPEAASHVFSQVVAGKRFARLISKVVKFFYFR